MSFNTLTTSSTHCFTPAVDDFITCVVHFLKICPVRYTQRLPAGCHPPEKDMVTLAPISGGVCSQTNPSWNTALLAWLISAALVGGMLARLLVFSEQFLPSLDPCEAACSVIKMIHKPLKDCMCSSLISSGDAANALRLGVKFGKYFLDFPRWHGIASCYGVEHALATLLIYPNLATSNRYAHGGCVEAFPHRNQSTLHLLGKC